MLTYVEQHANVKIAESKDRGKVLVATKRIEPELPFGFHVYTDQALLVMPLYGTEDDKSGDPPEILKPGPQMWADWWAYRQQPEDVQERVLSLFTDMKCPHADAVRNYLLEKQDELEEEKRDESFDKGILDHIEEFVQFAMVIRFNSVELNPPKEDGSGPGPEYGHGLFETACRMSHSCRPNCVWITTQDGRAKEVRVVKTIEDGEELTIDYVGDQMEPIPQRRHELWLTKGFTCECVRCSAAHDDTRRFCCVHSESTGCDGTHFLAQAELSDSPYLSSCSKCGAEASNSYLKLMLEKESFLVNEINALNFDEIDAKDCAERIEQLDPPHQLHCLAEKCYQMQGEFFAGRGDYQLAAEAYAKQLKCRIAILGDDYHSQGSAFCCERLGDALQHVNIKEAEQAYKRVVRHIQVLRGGISDPYSLCAVKKLMDVQHRRALSDPRDLPELRSFEGIVEAVPDATNYAPNVPSCDMCGNPASLYQVHEGRAYKYCCSQHKELHRSLLYVTAKEEAECKV